MKVLEYYKSIGAIKVIPWELPKPLPNVPETRSAFLRSQTWQRRRLEILPYNHCFYQNLRYFRDEQTQSLQIFSINFLGSITPK